MSRNFRFHIWHRWTAWSRPYLGMVKTRTTQAQVWKHRRECRTCGRIQEEAL